MARPTDDNDKNPNNKKTIELSPSMLTILSNGVMLVIIIIAFIIMYVLLDSSMNKKIAKLMPQEEQEQLEEGEEGKKEGILLDLEEFILNLSDVGARRYLKVGVALELSKTEEEIEAALHAASAKPSGGHGHGAAAPVDPNAVIIAEMERYKPAIKDAVISVLSNKTSMELSSPTGKEIAKEEILEMVNNLFEGKREVMRVSFSQFIIQ